MVITLSDFDSEQIFEFNKKMSVDRTKHFPFLILILILIILRFEKVHIFKFLSSQ